MVKERTKLLRVSTHAPRAGSDTSASFSIMFYWFQLTLPERGATKDTYYIVREHKFQLTLPERGATGVATTHATCAWFQLTLPERGATGLPLRTSAGGGFNSRSPSGERLQLSF